MKNIVKYMMAAAVMTATFPVLAQNLPEDVYEEGVNKDGKPNGIAYKKSATLKPGTTDTYVIDLETFVTGSVTVENKSVPADIVLVLDVSSSMNQSINTYTAENKTWNSSNIGDNHYYKDGDNYYRVYYYNGYGLFYSTGYNYVQLGDTYTGTLYTYTRETKIDALKKAVGLFIDEIHRNDLYDDENKRRKDEKGNDTSLGNQISIVKYGMDTYYSNSTDWIYGSNTEPTITPGNHFPELREYNNAYIYRNFSDDYYASTSYQRANCTEVIRGFTPTSTDSDVQLLKDDVGNLIASGVTAADYGMSLATELIKSIKDTRPESNKTVVFFTDGQPNHSGGFVTSVASSTIGYAHELKSTYNATVFSIGVFSDLGNDANNVNNYMNYVSSNYPDALNMSQGGSAISTDPKKLVYYQNASGADLSAIFKSVAKASGGSGNTDVAEGSVVTVDVVASSFSLPEGVTADDITVKVAPCEGKKSITWENEDGETITKDYLTFGEAKEATQYKLPAITPTVDASKRTVSTTGFDFSKNWCGYNESEKKYQGYKQIISFEIKVNEDAVGGPNVPTNEKESGIYVDGKQIAEFNRPHVPIPVSIWIMKQGLLGDDSAVFTIRYAPYQKDVDPTTITDWKSFTKVMISKDSPLYAPDPKHPEKKYPMEKLVGLDPNFFYKIDEDKWAWSYDYQDNGTQYTVGANLVNPFKFTNTPKDTVREAEATVRNVFAKKSTE